MKRIVEARDIATGEVIHREIASRQRAAVLSEIETIRCGSTVVEISVQAMQRGDRVVQVFGRSEIIDAAIRQMQEKS